MKKIFGLLMIMSVSLTVFAGGPSEDTIREKDLSINGIVRDKISGEHLTGVRVKLEGKNTVEYTDFDGKFSIDHLKPGKYKLQIEYVSYDRMEVKELALDSKNSGTLKIELQPSTAGIGSIIQ